MGQRKIEIEMVKGGSTRRVTFSKRRTGLFKKANELTTLCAAHFAIIVFSPGAKPFSFGHPDVQSVVLRFLNWHRSRQTDSSSELAIVVVNENDGSEAKWRRMVDMLSRLRADDSTFKSSVDGLGMSKLKEYRKSLEGIRGKLRTRINELEVSVSLLLLVEGPANGE